MKVIPIEGNKNLVRDETTNAIINTNSEALKAARKKKEREISLSAKIESNSKDINNMKEDLSEIKKLLQMLIERE